MIVRKSLKYPAKRGQKGRPLRFSIDLRNVDLAIAAIGKDAQSSPRLNGNVQVMREAVDCSERKNAKGDLRAKEPAGGAPDGAVAAPGDKNIRMGGDRLVQRRLDLFRLYDMDLHFMAGYLERSFRLVRKLFERVTEGASRFAIDDGVNAHWFPCPRFTETLSRNAVKQNKVS